MAEVGESGIAPVEHGANQIARTSDFVPKNGPEGAAGAVMPRRDSKQAGQNETTYSSYTEVKKAADHLSDITRNANDAAVLGHELGIEKGSPGSEVPQVPDNIFKRLLQKISRPPKVN